MALMLIAFDLFGYGLNQIQEIRPQLIPFYCLFPYQLH
jgi:hypothetical protein